MEIFLPNSANFCSAQNFFSSTFKFKVHKLYSKNRYMYGGIIRTYIVLFFYLVRATFLFRTSFFSIISCSRLFILYVVFSFLLSRAHDFCYFVYRFFFSIISCAKLFYFVDRFFFSILSCARLFFYNPTLHFKRRALHQKINPL